MTSFAFAGTVAVPFNLGFVGDVGNNAQQANDITLLSSMGVSRIIFSQSSDTSQFQIQGNDIPGTLRFITSSGAVDVAGTIVWRWRLNTGSEPYSLGFIPNENVSKSWTHNSTTYTITGLASDGSFKTIADDGVATSNIGVAVIGATFNVVNGDDVSGNAANLSSVLDSLNTYLATSGSGAPSGPVSVVSQTTNDSTPTVTGSVTLQSGEHLEVTINGVTYTTSNGLTVSGTTWSVTLPSTSDGTYNVDAEILNDDGFVLSDSTSSELIIDTVGATITGPGSSTGSTASLSVDEEQTSVFSFTASETVTWSITGGADSALFAVNSSTGVVTFSSAPDYENPGDSNTDNDYVFEITATDSLGNTTVQTVTVTVLDVTGSIAGTVTNARTGAVVSGVTVKLYNSSNTLLATTTTDANGDYEFSGRSAGTYIVEFRPTTKAAKGRSDRGQVNGRYVESITISGEEDLTDVDGILIDPSGVVYDSDTRSPVENAVVQLFVLPDSGGSRREVLDSELDQSLGGVSGQTTGSDGLYNFILNGSAPSGVYDIVVTPPATHTFESSEITKSSGPYTPALGGGVETIQSQSTAPSGSEATTYYLSFDFTITATSSTSSNGVINNHIPVDPLIPSLTITKTADSTSIVPASSGDTISYTITVKNTGNVTFTSLSLTDALTSNEAWSASDAGDTDGTGALNVGETWTFTASYTITSSDITNGSVENVAYATGVPASGSNLTVYSGAQGVASTSTSDPSGGGGVITTLSRVNLISLIYDDLRDILSDDLAQTATQLSDQANSIVQGAFDRTRGYDLGYCADRLNQLLKAEPILFNIGSSELKAEADKILKDALALLRDCPRGSLFVEGHKDAIGNPELNFRLGYARAKAVIDRLNQLSEFPTNLVAVEYGEDRPLGGSHSNAAENSNSHVVFRAKDENHANCSNRNEHHGSSDGHAGPGVFTVNASGNLQQVDCSANMARDLSWSVSTMDLDSNNDQLMISATFKQETGVETAYLRGWYLSAYHSGNDISNRATGDISGQGLAAGLYGVARRPSGLAFDYLLGAFAGQHDFDLDFSRTRGVISAKGHYRYFGANWRLGLSGETGVRDLPVRPQVFISGTNADAEAAKVTA